MSKKNKKKFKLQEIGFTFKTKYFNWIIAGIIILGTALRFITWNNVVTSDGTVQLKGADAYYFAQEARNIVKTGKVPQYDQMLCYPDGLKTNADNLLYSYVLAGASKVMPLEMATALSGPLFAGLSALGIFLILKILFPNNNLAVIAGTSIASFTGLQFLARSYFGFGDRHVLEVFFTVYGIWTTLKAITKQKWYWSILAFICHVLFIYTWTGASLIILFFGLSLLIHEFSRDYYRQRYYYYLGIYIPLLIFSIFTQNSNALMVSTLLSGGVALIWFSKYKFKTLKQQLFFFFGLGAIALVLIYIFLPSLFNFFINTIKSYIFQDEVSSSISEFRPMFAIYQTWYNLLSEGGVQVFIHFLTAVGFIYMIENKDYKFLFFGITLLIVSIAKIRGEYYLWVINAISISYIANEHKNFAYFSLIVAAYFSMLYWGTQLSNKNSSLVFTSNDYKMAAWMKTNLPSNDNSNYWTLTRWDLGYLYAYLSERHIYASPNLCNYLFPSQFGITNDEESAYNMLKNNNVKYVLLKFVNSDSYYGDYIRITGNQPEIIPVTINKQEQYLVNTEYFESMYARLFNFNANGIDAKSAYYLKNDKLQQTDNYSDAILKSQNGKVYSISELSSTIKLDALKHFKLIHTEGTDLNSVKLFEVIDK